MKPYGDPTGGVGNPTDLPKMGNEVHPLMGSGYDRGFKAGQKQGGAEVLAACKAHIAQAIHVFDGCRDALTDDLKIRLSAAEGLLKSLDKLQPAASALEELLREAELKGRIAQLKMMKGEAAGGMWFPDPGFPTINDRIAELEKARAEGKERLAKLKESA